MKLGCGEAAATATIAGERTSFNASTMLTTGSVPAAAGWSGFEMKARNLRPLREPVLERELLLLPQESSSTPAAVRLRRNNPFFKRKTPRRMKDRGLDARSGIITEASLLNGLGQQQNSSAEQQSEG